MAILSLSEVTNDYGSYRGNSLIGERGAAVTVPNDGLEGIVGKPYPFLNGILVKIGGTIYTDQGYLNALKRASNPYVSKRSLPMVSFPSLDALTQEVEDVKVHDDNGGTYRTQYAEVGVTKRMSTVEDILFYLNDFFNPNTSDEVLAPEVLGSFNFSTTNYSADLDVNGLYPGLEFETYEDIATATTVKISTPPNQTEPKKAEPEIVVDIQEEKPLSVVVPQEVIEIKQKLPGGLPITSTNTTPISGGTRPGGSIIPRGALFDELTEYETQEIMRPSGFGSFGSFGSFNDL